jgi:hypothetical protein
MVYEDAIIRVGNKGTVIDVTVYDVNGNTQTALDLSQANSYQIEFARPNGSTQTVTGSVKNSPGSDGKVTYTDTNGVVFNHTLAKKGRWQVRGIVGYSNGNVFKGSWEGFTVGD